jgi:hypothetical protein
LLLTVKTTSAGCISRSSLVLPWLMADPLLTGQQAMQRLEQEHPGLYLGSLRTWQRRMGEWRVTHAEQVLGQQMGAIRDQDNSQLNSKKSLRSRRQLGGCCS